MKNPAKSTAIRANAFKDICNRLSGSDVISCTSDEAFVFLHFEHWFCYLVATQAHKIKYPPKIVSLRKNPAYHGNVLTVILV